MAVDAGGGAGRKHALARTWDNHHASAPARAGKLLARETTTNRPETALGTRRTALAATALAVAAPRAFAQAPIVIKFSHVVAVDTPKGNGSEFFAKRAAELTKGRVKVEVYPNSQLYKDKEEMEALQLGAVQMLAPSLSKFAPLGVKEFEVFDFPYLFDSYEDLHRVTDGAVGNGLMAKLDAKGITGLAFWDNGFKSFSSNRRMAKPEDLKGLKMRIQSSKVLEAQMRALGAIPQVMAFSEVYQALQTGVVDGTENPHSNLYSQKMNEVQKHVTITDHGYVGYAVVVNKKFWDALPGDIRAQLTQAMADATKFTNDSAFKDNEDALAKVRATGKTEILTLSKADRVPWKRALIRVHKEMESRVGSEILQAVYKETGFDPAKL
jgi:C4-dicarboxylate-binding protein DctP